MNDSGRPCDDECLRLCIRAGRLVYHWLSRYLRVVGLTPVQYEILDLLNAQRDGLALSDVRRRLCCVGSNATAVVDRMERDGLVERQQDPSDRRVVRVTLTDEGRERLGQVVSGSHTFPEFDDMLTAEERSQMTALLRTVVAKMAARA